MQTVESLRGEQRVALVQHALLRTRCRGMHMSVAHANGRCVFCLAVRHSGVAGTQQLRGLGIVHAMSCMPIFYRSRSGDLSRPSHFPTSVRIGWARSTDHSQCHTTCFDCSRRSSSRMPLQRAYLDTAFGLRLLLIVMARIS